MLRLAGLEVTVLYSADERSWEIFAEPPQGMRRKGEEKLAEQVSQRAAGLLPP